MMRSRAVTNGIVRSVRASTSASYGSSSTAISCTSHSTCSCLRHSITARSLSVTAHRSSSYNRTSRLYTPTSTITVHRRGFAGKYPPHITLTMPALSPTMEKGNLAKWTKKVGEKISVGEEMAEVETDKATVAFEAVEEGYLAKILLPDGSQDVTVGTPVAVLAEEKADVDKFKDFSGDESGGSGGSAPPPPQPKDDKEEKASKGSKKKAAAKDGEGEKRGDELPERRSESSGAAETQKQDKPGDRVIASPAAKRVAGELGVDLSKIKGTGPNDRIIQADVKEAQASGKPQQPAAAPASKPSAKPTAASAEGDYTDIPHSNIRKVIATRLLQSKQTIPHYYLTMECNVDKLMKVRSELNAKLTESGVKISVNDFIVKAAALACRKVPQANSSWMDNAIRQYNYVDVSVAVSTDSGLITPIVKDADVKGLTSIATEVKDLATRARAGKLQPNEFQGGTFTISNLGMYGINHFAAVINPPQAAILAIGGADSKIILNDTGAPVSTSVIRVTMSCDHRVVDGAVGAQWLQAFKGFMENPMTMLL